MDSTPNIHHSEFSLHPSIHPLNPLYDHSGTRRGILILTYTIDFGDGEFTKFQSPQSGHFDSYEAAADVGAESASFQSPQSGHFDSYLRLVRHALHMGLGFNPLNRGRDKPSAFSN